MPHKDYDSFGSGFSERVESHIEELERACLKARKTSFIVEPDTGIWRKIGNRTFYRLYGLHHFSIRTHPNSQTGGWQEAFNASKSRVFGKDGTYTFNAQLSLGASGKHIEGETNVLSQNSQQLSYGCVWLEGASFPANTDLVTIPDGIFDLTIEKLSIKAGPNTKSAIHVVTPTSAGIGHQGINFDFLKVAGNVADNTNYLIQIDQNSGSRWGAVTLTHRNHLLQWQNNSQGSATGNGHIGWLRVAPNYNVSVSSLLVNFLFTGFLDIGSITGGYQTLATTNQVGIQLDSSGPMEFREIDMENCSTCVSMAASTGDCANNVFLGGYLAGVNSVAFNTTQREYSNSFVGIYYDPQTSTTGYMINGDGNNPSYYNLFLGGQTGFGISKLYNFTNMKNVLCRDVNALNHQQANFSTPAVPVGTGSANAVANNNPFDVIIEQASSSGTRIIDAHGMDRPLYDSAVQYLPAYAKIYYTTSVPATWIWLGL